jgi:hypothetical protein
MKTKFRLLARLGSVATLWLLTTTAAMAADVTLRVPVRISNPDPSWESAEVSCLAALRSGGSFRGRVYSIPIPRSGELNRSYNVRVSTGIRIPMSDHTGARSTSSREVALTTAL